MNIVNGIMLAAITSSLFVSTARAADDSNKFSPLVDATGNISRPLDFRRNWVHLGSWLVKDDEHASGPGVHDVYADPAAVKTYLDTGKWQDGAALVKAISAIQSRQLTTGNAQWAGDTGVWFVMIKDRNKRFPDHPAWGGGWGWALFKSDAPEKNITSDWQGEGLNNCYGCHLPAKSTDWVYIEGYPTLR